MEDYIITKIVQRYKEIIFGTLIVFAIVVGVVKQSTKEGVDFYMRGSGIVMEPVGRYLVNRIEKIPGYVEIYYKFINRNKQEDVMLYN